MLFEILDQVKKKERKLISLQVRNERRGFNFCQNIQLPVTNAKLFQEGNKKRAGRHACPSLAGQYHPSRVKLS